MVKEFGTLQKSASDSQSSGSRDRVLAYLDIDWVKGSRRAAEEQRCDGSQQERGMFSHGAGLRRKKVRARNKMSDEKTVETTVRGGRGNGNGNGRKRRQVSGLRFPFQENQ